MKLGLFTPLFSDLSLDEVIGRIRPLGIQAVELAAGTNVGSNFDPSHLFWQGIDPCLAVRELGEAIFHVHAKDTRIYETNSRLNGVLDTKPYGDEANRSWMFRTVGFGHGPDFWNDFISTLSMVGYDGVISIEHEDSLMSVEDGLEKAATFLNQILIRKKSPKFGGPSSQYVCRRF
jgi:sugar phosphate isomerase/epimerase